MLFSIADCVRLFVSPGTCTEVRGLFRSKVNPDDRYCRNQYVRYEDADAISESIHKLDQEENCIGIYLVANQVKNELYELNQSKTRKPFFTKVKSSSTADMVARKWLFVDCDSVRPSDVSATDGERSRAFQLADNVIETLSALGFGKPIKADSGNGCHLLYPVDMPVGKSSDLQIKEFLAELSTRCTVDGAKVDLVTYDSQRMIRLYGTKARKGDSTPERPWRVTGIVSVGDTGGEARKQNTESIGHALEVWHDQNELANALFQKQSPIERAKNYVAHIEPAISGRGGSNVTYRACSILVEGFGLSIEDSLAALHEWNASCVPPWSEHELRHKLEDASKKIDHSKLGSLLKGNDFPINSPVVEKPKADRRDATVEDLIRMGQSMQWIWPGWIQRGVIVGVAAEPGAGKTRFCADITKRIHNHLPWPDGTPPTLDRGASVLWVCSDNQWGEICQFPEQFGFPGSAVFLNSWDDDPTEGTVLDNAKQFKALEDRINRTGVQLVFIDTVMNSTTHNTMRPEDGIKFFKPLAEIAQKTNTTIILVTHLSSGGEALGRRIVGQCRQMISLQKVDGEPIGSNLRKLFVSKSNSVIPPELEVRMGNSGNEYRDPGAVQPVSYTIDNWTRFNLSTGRKLKNIFITDAKMAGYNDTDIASVISRLTEEVTVSGMTYLRVKNAT